MRQKGVKTPFLLWFGTLQGVSVFTIGAIVKLLPAVSRSITGCFVTQNIGEVARSDGGVENNISSVCLYRFSLAVPRSIAGCCGAI